MFSRILLLSLPATVWSAITVAPQSLEKFKEDYNEEKKTASLDSALKILIFNDAIRGSTAPAAGSSAFMWDWYSAVTGSKKVEAQQFLEKVEKDGLVHEQVLGTFVGELKKVMTGDDGKLDEDAINLKALLGSTLPVKVADGVNEDTVKTWKDLQLMSVTTKEQVIELAKVKMYDLWSTQFDKDYKDTLTDYQKITECFAKTIQEDLPTEDTNKGVSNWKAYSQLPAEIQSKMRAYMLEKMKARII